MHFSHTHEKKTQQINKQLFSFKKQIELINHHDVR